MGGRYHVEPAFPVFEGLLVQAQEHPSSNPIQTHPGPVPGVLCLEEVKEHVHGGIESKVIAENLKCPDESPGIWMELAGRDVQLHHQLLLEKGE